MEYIGIYHADGGLVGEARYVIGHLLGRTNCSLCSITHSPVRRKKQWDELVASLGATVHLYHLNEMPDDVGEVVAREGSPLFLVRDRHGLRVVLTPAQLDAMGGSVDAFAVGLKQGMRDRDESGRAYNTRPRDELGRPLGREEAGIEPLPAELDTHPAAVVALTQELLDAGRPFQAHEVLEAAWKEAPADQRGAWKGLAQLAVAITHDRRGNAVGADRLRSRAHANLRDSQLPPVAAALRDRLLIETEHLSDSSSTPR